ncbi:uncharacterized protein LOC132558806 [Ylistrum balloti]|uniref:uncharacterized protein LOC132558806 n=1 Tax=Ylistrum balloti TaxID=509963 RepID=UPI002905EEF4|nr:uncharacterized protein LOC132558806 [Ylistrum balloti]
MGSVTLPSMFRYSSLSKLVTSSGRLFRARSLPALTSLGLHDKQQRHRSSNSAEPIHKVLYDGKCPLCVKEVDLLRKFNRGSVNFFDITKGNYNPADHQGIQYEDAMGALHVISPDKKLYVGMDGTRELYRAVGFGWVVAWTELPGIKWVADSAYRWFALNRFWLTGRLGENKDDDCDSGRCKITKDSQQKR